jgi:hypothetical protein
VFECVLQLSKRSTFKSLQYKNSFLLFQFNKFKKLKPVLPVQRKLIFNFAL